MIPGIRLAAFAVVALAAWAMPVAAPADTLTYDSAAGRQTVEGRVMARTESELLFLARDGRIHRIDDPQRIVRLDEAAAPPRPLTQQEMAARLAAEFGPGFQVHRTNHYLVCYNCDSEFARSCGVLFEKLHKAFDNFFQHKLPVQPNEYPLVALVFANQQDFQEYAEREVGREMAENVIGYYSFLSNRIAMYDMQWGGPRLGLGNIAGARAAAAPRGVEGLAQVNLATIVHEATHQLAYNCGFHRRFSDNPLWLAEGLAMFFETPNPKNGQWGGPNAVNQLRMPLFRQEFLAGPKKVDIASLVRDDNRLGPERTTLADYAEAWALTYFLVRRHPREFCAYMKRLAEKPPLARDGPEQRLEDFRAAFGGRSDDASAALDPDRDAMKKFIDKLQDDFVRTMRGVRGPGSAL